VYILYPYIAAVPVSQRTVQYKHNSANVVYESIFCLLRNYMKKFINMLWPNWRWGLSYHLSLNFRNL